MFSQNKVIDYKVNKNIYSCHVLNDENKKYDVMVKLDSSNEIIDSSCNCLYRAKNGKERLCKHVGALLTRIHHNIDVGALRKELLKKLEKIKLMLDDVDYIIKNENKYFKKDVLKQLETDYDRLLSGYNSELGHVKVYNNQDLMVSCVRSIDIFINEIKERLNASLNNEILQRGIIMNLNINIENNIAIQSRKKHKASLINLVNLVTIAKGKNKNTIWDPNIYGLSKEEKELVKKGDYDSWNFEEEGPFDEDDYHSEDV